MTIYTRLCPLVTDARKNKYQHPSLSSKASFICIRPAPSDDTKSKPCLRARYLRDASKYSRFRFDTRLFLSPTTQLILHLLIYITGLWLIKLYVYNTMASIFFTSWTPSIIPKQLFHKCYVPSCILSSIILDDPSGKNISSLCFRLCPTRFGFGVWHVWSHNLIDLALKLPDTPAQVSSSLNNLPDHTWYSTQAYSTAFPVHLLDRHLSYSLKISEACFSVCYPPPTPSTIYRLDLHLADTPIFFLFYKQRKTIWTPFKRAGYALFENTYSSVARVVKEDYLFGYYFEFATSYRSYWIRCSHIPRLALD